MILFENKEDIAKTIQKVRDSPYSDFYRNKFHNFQKDHIPTLEEIPFLTREELVDVLPDERLYVPKDEVDFISVTSGTISGKPLISFFSDIEVHLEPSLEMDIKRPLIIFPHINKNFGYLYINTCRKAQVKITPIFGDYQNMVNSAFLAKETFADSVFATPTLAIMLGKVMSKFYDPKNIRLLMLSSETITSNIRKELLGLYPNAKIANLYASSEIGNFILYPCIDLIDKGVDEFHFSQNDLSAVELIDGELVITYTLNKAFPLIRYRTGDFFEVAQERCTCGILGATLKWSGRVDVDKIKIHGFEITLPKVEETFNKVAPVIGKDYQVHFYDSELKPNRISVVIEVKKQKGVVHQDESISYAKTALLNKWYITPTMSFGKAVEQNIFDTLDIVFVNDFSFQSSKTRRLINHI